MSTGRDKPPLVQDVVDELEKLAPARLAQLWDNVGLITGDPARAVERVLLCIDYTPVVAQEAEALDCQFVISYHPPLFAPVRRLTVDVVGEHLLRAIRKNIAIYSPHTALDVVVGGTNDALADLLGMVDRRPLRVAEDSMVEKLFKLAVFVPVSEAEAVADALFAAGAGRLGEYDRCSFRSEGVGTFRPGDGANPTIGRSGELERVQETRLELLVGEKALSATLVALHESHPYEEPAYDLFAMVPPPEGIGSNAANASHASNDGRIGLGRRGRLPRPLAFGEVVQNLRESLSLDQFLVAGPVDRTITTVVVCAGSCGELLDEVIAARPDLYVTGEMRHHDALKATAAGLSVIVTGHSNSERPVLKVIADRLNGIFPTIHAYLSKTDHDPLTITTCRPRL